MADKIDGEGTTTLAVTVSRAVEFGANSRDFVCQMARTTVRSRILAYWRSIELFSAQSVPPANPNNRREPVFRVQASEPLPWQPCHSLTDRWKRPGYVRRHVVYGGLFRSDSVRTLLEERFGADPEVFDRPGDTAYCLFAFEVGESGRPLLDTFALSSLGWALARTLAPGPEDPNWLTGFAAAEKSARLDFEHRHAMRGDGENPFVPDGANVEPDGDGGPNEAVLEVDKKSADATEPPERPLDHEDLVREVQGCIARFEIGTLVAKPMLRVRCRQVSERRDAAKNEPVLLNSFFVDDLDRVADAVEVDDPGAALASYLTAGEDLDVGSRVDVRRSPGTLFEALAPAAFPASRWPERNGYPLVASQQFAVNTVVRTLGEGAGIAAVNGPPGTGKTTLLRDLIANVVVERAKRLAALDSAEDAFEGSAGWMAGRYRRTIWHWTTPFHGHEIVIASSNNGAVENVTLEIPGIDAIDPAALDGADHFQELASHVLGKEAWGLMAAKLGKRRNRAEFRSRFWFDRDADEEDAPPLPGMQSLLDRYRGEPVDWRGAVEAFEAAIAETDRLRVKRQRVYVRGVRLRELGEAVKVARTRCDDLDTRLMRAQAASVEAKGGEARARDALKGLESRRLDHRRFRPGLIEILFTFGRAFREWRVKDAALASGIEANERELALASDERSVRAEEQAVCELASRDAREQLDALTNELADKIADQTLAAAALGIDLPDPDTDDWHDDTTRELSAPWADETWNAARQHVFVAALALHRAFLRANAVRMQQSLRAAMDLLEGSVPDEAPSMAVADAWRALFFVVPVVSTTFASFARLFPQLGPGSLGWVLVDEAGQAPPQEAAGAFWRARRAVVVGDPLQLEPIVPIPLKAQEALRRHHGVDGLWTPGRTSTQRLADRVARWGTYVASGEQSVWVGSPLRVHRRCDAPMVGISNAIAYDGMMVDGTPMRALEPWPASGWIDVRSVINEGHWIEAEGEMTDRLLEQLISFHADPAEMFLISPFRDVVDRLRDIAARYPGIRASTVHTTQGKEADIVVLVLGSDPASAGAREWAASSPNLLNVAVSRAKRRLYVIGDLSAWRRCNYFSTCAMLLERHVEREAVERTERES